MVRRVVTRGALSGSVSTMALSGASVKTESRECAAQFLPRCGVLLIMKEAKKEYDEWQNLSSTALSVAR